MRPRQFALVLLCATVTLGGRCAARLAGLAWSDIENTATSIWNRAAARGATTSLAPAMAAATSFHLKLPEGAVAHAAVPAAVAARGDPDPREPAFGRAGSAAAEAPAVEDPLSYARPTTPPETHERLLAPFRPQPAGGRRNTANRPLQ